MTTNIDRPFRNLLGRLRATANPDVAADIARLQAWSDWQLAEHQREMAFSDADTRRARRPLIFRERDVTRAIAGHLKAGLSIARTEIDRSGRIVIVTGKPESTELARKNEWDTL